MKLTVKTLQGVAFNIEAESFETVRVDILRWLAHVPYVARDNS